MNYCFMHTEKIKSFTNMAARYRHNYRTVDVKNADKSLLDQNNEVLPLPYNFDGEQMNYNQAWTERVKNIDYYKNHNVRKNGVLAYEVVTTFSREKISDVNVEDWQKENVKWLEKTFNVAPDGKSNILSVVYHGDESGNVHCHAVVVPIDERGRLNARRFTGEPQKLVQMQNSYAKSMERFGLVRGISNSRATHTDIKRFYSALNKKIEAPAMKEGERFGDYIERTKDYFKTQMAAAYKKELDDRRKGAEELAKQKARERAAIRKEMEATRQISYETLKQLQKSEENISNRKQQLGKEIEHLMSQKAEIADGIHEAEFELQKLQTAAQKAAEYDRLQERLADLYNEDPERMEQIAQLLFRDEEKLDNTMPDINAPIEER